MIKPVLMFLMMLAAAFSTAKAHHTAASVTEVEWNSVSLCFEVAMRLRICDLEDAISAERNTRFRIEENQRSAPELVAYLSRHFSLTHSPEHKSVIRWVGCELELHDVWLYLEVTPLSTSAPAVEMSSGHLAKKPNKVDQWQDLFNHNAADNNHSIASEQPIIVRHTALTEVQPQQTNVISVQRGSGSASIALSKDKPVGKL